MNEDRRIREAFDRELEPPSPGFSSRMRSALVAPPPARAPRRWPFGAAAGAIAVLVVAALTLPHLFAGARTPAPAEQPGVVPWADLPAPNVAQPFTKPGVPACHASQLTFDVHVPDPSYIGAGPKDTTFWDVRVTNSSAVECFVGPMLDIVFTTADGPLQLKRQEWPGDIVYLQTGLWAGGEISAASCVEPRITRMTISPGKGLGSVDVDPGPAGGWGTPCPDRSGTYFVELFTDAGQGGALPSTETAMQAPASARPGEHVRFLVSISDVSQVSRGFGPPRPSPTPSPIVWSTCPTYHMELEGIEGTFHTYRLNCAAASTIAPNGTETFEMFIDVPGNAHPGPATLVWSIDGSPEQWARATAYVPIES